MLIVCYLDSFEAYSISPNYELKSKMEAKYGDPNQSYAFIAAPDPLENVLNIFFEEVDPDYTSIKMWLCQL